MAWITATQPNFAVQLLLQQIVAVGKLSRYEHMQLTSAILADDQLTDEDRRHIGRVLDYVQIGRLRLVD